MSRNLVGPTNSLYISTMMPTITSSMIIRQNAIERRIENVPRSVANLYYNVRSFANIPTVPTEFIIGNNQQHTLYRFKTYFDINPDVDEYLFDIDEKEQENLTSDIICSICLTETIKPTELTEPEASNDDENNLTNNKFCHLSCSDTNKFHSQCIKSWLKQNLTCTCCRAIPEKNNLISSASEKIVLVNSPMIYTNDLIDEQLTANGSESTTN
jgi:hypothetical protein